DLKNNANATNIPQSNQTSTNINSNLDFNKYNEETAIKFSNDASGIFDLLNDYVLRVRFVKTNGEYRTIWATRNQSIINSLDKQPKSNKSEYELIQEREKQLLSRKIKVIDLEKGDWRVLSLDNLVVDNTVENLPNIIRYKVDEYIWLKILNNEISVKESLKNYYIDYNGIVSVGNYGDFLAQEEQEEQV
ncbi:SH3 beta-barrel fold-containing protein, partial [Sutterella wadsworthensis]|uniref:SH3 beta-barrel fold-containing protein n=1 Tax=Sutterella wadsworthensis TaxID=40545 RepID=UPI0032BF5C02